MQDLGMWTSSSLKRPGLHIRSKSSPLDAYSITMARCVGVKITYSKFHKSKCSTNRLSHHLPWRWHNIPKEWSMIKQTSLNLKILGCLNNLWLIISLWTFSSICKKIVLQWEASKFSSPFIQKYAQNFY